MHHQDFSADQPAGTGSRKQAYHYRRGSSSASAPSTPGGSGANPADDIPAQPGSNSPALHHQSQAAGAQVKKKSGFQITSVTSAQSNVSGNNSLADDTESYDDMDESHTEDLSSSDMLDVSVSRATDTGVPERSSSDETLNSLHGVDTPGIVSPNEPLHPHSIPQGSQQHTSMVNGTMHYYPPHHHHSDSVGGSEPGLPVAPVASSSPAMASKAGQAQRQPMLDNSKPAAQPIPPMVGGTDPHLQGSVSNVPAAAAGPSDNTSVSGQVVPAGGGTAPNAQTQHTQTQTATGSRFRVVKLDTNSEPFRKGRWTCTDYYEKEVPHPTTSEAPKGVEVAVETEAGNVPAVQPPHTLQSYQQPSQDFTSPQAMQSPQQGLAQTTTLTYVSPQEVVAGSHMQQPVANVMLPTAMPQLPAVIPQQLPYTVDPHQAGGYPVPQFHTGVIAPGSVRQPDFIQPTAPFQTQVQPPLPHLTTGILPPIPGVTAQPPISITHQLPHPGQPAFTGQQQTLPPPQIQPPSTATVPVLPTHMSPYMPLTALQADLQPLLNLGATLTQVPGGGSSIRASQLEDAHKLLLQHQGLLGLPGLPRLGVAVSREGAAEAGGAAGTLAHMGMSAEASAFMAAAAGLRTQHAEGEDDSSSGASVVAIDNKIEQAMDLVKSHLMYAVREEVEVLKEQIKELIERNTQLEQENNLLKNLASPEQMAQFQAQVQTGVSPTGNAAAAAAAGQPPVPVPAGTTQALPSSQSSGTSA
ncbi:TSC22 domain family protein 1 isoform X1 [Sebastes umbrosus]|uniref:TSC22 domain family protein 1 isoform X1 n=1 Tax=Sebastes umbrosus TaxID=72105 RepID=UPI0018A0357A|nr:TSC22 domain family protein 1 isoform X1 [Sebastes umbrosus]XP_037617612.1 TSC22 domain family protein 1 isoform X1 [Sebastes umbrosus]